MVARARFARATVEGRTVVPADAVIEDGLGARVVVLDRPAAADAQGEDGRPLAPTARIVPVRVLAADATRAAVQALDPAALAPGDLVIVTGADNVYPGASLAPAPPLDAAVPRGLGATDASGTSGAADGADATGVY
jgi:hypothetical protein